MVICGCVGSKATEHVEQWGWGKEVVLFIFTIVRSLGKHHMVRIAPSLRPRVSHPLQDFLRLRYFKGTRVLVLMGVPVEAEDHLFTHFGFALSNQKESSCVHNHCKSI